MPPVPSNPVEQARQLARRVETQRRLFGSRPLVGGCAQDWRWRLAILGIDPLMCLALSSVNDVMAASRLQSERSLRPVAPCCR